MKTARKSRPAPAAQPAAAPAVPSAPARKWRPHALAIAALWVVALAAWSNSFRTGFPYDNSWAILQDTRIREATPRNLDLILTQDYWSKTTSSGLYRPLTTLSFLFNYAILGGGAHPAGYHWVNFALHAANIALVYLVGLLLLGEAPLAFALAAVWGVHPVLTESVTNIVGRADLLAAFGVLAGLLCHVRATAAAGPRKAAWLAALMCAAAVGMFSKESGVVVLAAMAIYDFTYWKAAKWRVRVPGYAALAPPLFLFFLVRSRVFASLPAPIFPFVDNPLVGAGFWTARLTAVKVIGKYLWLLVWPARLSSDYSYNQVPLVSWRLDGVEDWKAYLALAVCMGAAAIAWICYRRSKPVFFFIAFFFATLAPTANIAVLIGTIMAERFLYLPSIAFAGCLVMAVYAAVKRLDARLPGARAAAPVALALVVVALAGRTYARNFDWQDDVTLWASAARNAPRSYKSHMNLAGAWSVVKGSDPAAAVHEVDESLSILDSLPDGRNVPAVYANAGMWYRMRGETLPPAESRGWYEKSLAVLLRGEKIDRAAAQEVVRENRARGVVVSGHGWPPLYLELGRTYMRLSDPAKAVEAFEHGRSLSQKPEFSEELSRAYRALGDNDRAAISLIEGVTIDPHQTGFATELVELYKQTDPNGCAVLKTGAATSLNTDCPLVRSHFCAAFRNVAMLFFKTNQAPEANAVMRGAVQDFGCPAATFH